MSSSSAMETFGHNIQVCLDSLQWSKQELANRAEIAREEVSRIVGGKRNVSMRIAESISNALGYPLWELLSPKFRPRRKAA